MRDPARAIIHDTRVGGAVLALGARTAYRSGGTTSQDWSMLPAWTQPGFRIDDVEPSHDDLAPMLALDGANALLLESRDEGASWSLLHGRFSNTPRSIVRAADGALFVENGNWIDRSLDGGKSWDHKPVGQQPTVLLADPELAGTLHQTASAAYWRTMDGGETWTHGATGLPAQGGFVDVDIDASDSREVFLLKKDPARLYFSHDRGESWATVTDSFLPPDPIALAVDPSAPGRILIGTEEEGVWIRETPGESFVPWNEGLETLAIRDIIFEPRGSDVAWLVTARGDLFTYDFGCPDPLPYCSPKINSLGTSANLGWTGEPSAAGSGFAVTVSAAVPNEWMIGFFSLHGAVEQAFAGGLLCAELPVQRLAVSTLDASGSGAYSIPIDATQVGTTRWYQVIYRDPAHGDGTGVGLSDGLAVLFCR